MFYNVMWFFFLEIYSWDYVFGYIYFSSGPEVSFEPVTIDWKSKKTIVNVKK